jgi:hypothetical protein
VEIMIRKQLDPRVAFDGLRLDAASLARLKLGVVAAVKESFGDVQTISRADADRRMDAAVRFVLRCVGDLFMTPDRALAFLPAALPVELAGLEYPVPTGAVYRVPERGTVQA